MTGSNTFAYREFDEQKRIYFDSLRRSCGLGVESKESGEHYAIVSAAAGNVRAFFEHERGLCWFSIGAYADARPL